MDVKTLARDLPLYGRQAVRTALNRLSAAGHLRRVRERVGADGTQWVLRTYFSRAARADAWWAAFLAGDVPDEAATVPAAEPVAGYDVLAGAGRVDPRMSLSARECEELAPLAAQWLARGATEGEVVRALTDGLPPQVHRPGPFARRRLTDKLPPVRPPAPPAAPPHRLLECTDCGAPGRPEALPGGLCRRCRTDPAAEPPTRPYAPRPRAAIRTRERNTV